MRRKTLSTLLNRAKNVEIIKVFSLSFISTFVKMVTGFISIKVVALIIGPPGIALLGQLNNFSSIVLVLATGGIGSGIVKLISEHKTDNINIKKYVSVALVITLFSSLICAISLIVFNHQISQLILHSSSYRIIFVIFGFTIFFYALNMMLLSILNGFQSYKKYVKINIVNSIIGLVFTIVLVYFFELKGALISAITYQSVVFFFTFWYLRKEKWFKIEYFKEKWDKLIAKNYLQYTLMTFVSVATVPIAQLLLRSSVITQISDVHAGWWEGMNRISNMYLTIITTSLSVYYLPRLSEINDNTLLRKEILNAYKFVIPLLTVISISIYFLRFFIIRVLFSEEFMPMQNLFFWQLLGDFLKILSWLLAFLMVAKSMTLHFISTEIIFTGIFLFLGYMLLNKNGVVGLTQAYFVNYLIYMLLMLIFFRKIIFSN